MLEGGTAGVAKTSHEHLIRAPHNTQHNMKAPCAHEVLTSEEERRMITVALYNKQRSSCVGWVDGLMDGWIDGWVWMSCCHL